MLVLRIERPGTHEGPFANLSRIYTLDAIGFPSPRGMPVPFQDGAPDDWEEYRCGCISWDQLHEWFTDKQIAYLQSIGFEVVCFEVPDCHVVALHTQCLFCLKYATTLPLEEYNARVR